MSIKYKFLFTLLSIAFIPFLFIGLLVYSNARQLLIEEELSKLAVIRNLKVKQIEENLLLDKEKLKLVTSRTQMRQLLDEYEKNQNAQDLNRILKILKDARDAIANFTGISILDENGRIIVSTDENLTGMDKSGEAYFLKGKVQESADFFFRNRKNQLGHLMSGPLYFENKLIGVLVIESDAGHYRSIFTDYKELGKSGEYLFVLREGNYAVFVHPIRFDRDATFKRKIDINNLSYPSIRALAGKSGVFTDTVDYRGADVLSATYYFKDLDAGLVVKIDKSEALLPIRTFQTSFLIVGISVLAFIIIMVFTLTRTLTRSITQLSQASEKIAQGDFKSIIELNIHSKDEIGRLANSFRNMTLKLKEFYESLEAKVRERTRDLMLFRQSIDCATDGVLITTSEGNIIYVNQAWESITGYKLSEVSGKNPRFLKTDKTSPKLLSKLWRTISQGKKFQTDEIVNKRKDGTEYMAELHVFPVLENGKNLFYVEISQDISKRKEIEKLKDQFISLASHELRTPMTAIEGFVSMLFEGDFGQVPDQLKKPLTIIGDSTKRLILLVNDLLNVSRIEAGRINYLFAKAKLKEICDECILELMPLAKQKNLSISAEVDPFLSVRVDADKLKEIMQNILGNAIKFTDSGSITLSARTYAKTVTLFFIDTGVGIEFDNQKRLFGKFEQVRTKAIGRPTGSGLGLYISRELARGMGGDLWIEKSTPGKGSTLALSLPLAK